MQHVVTQASPGPCTRAVWSLSLLPCSLSAARSGGDCASRGRGRAVSGGPPAHGRQSPRGGAVCQQLGTGVPAPSPLTAGQTRTETLFCLFLKQSFLFLTTAAPWESDLMGEDVKTAFGAGVGNLLPTCFHVRPCTWGSLPLGRQQHPPPPQPAYSVLRGR